jgi:hypothetical protein
MSDVIWQPQPKQAEFMARGEYEVLYGGAAGGGKSDALLCEALRQVDIPNYRGILFRDTYPQLEGLISRSIELYKKAYPKATYNSSEKRWTFPSGAKIFFGYMQREADKYNYQGKAYDFIGFDELTHFTYTQYQYLKSRNRPTGANTRCYIRCTANPDGKGMGWVKERFVTPAPPMTTIWEEAEVYFPDGHKEVTRRSRVFVPSTVFDNKELLKNDPDYLSTLASLPEAEKNALLYGSWDAFSGQVFREWINDPKHYKDRVWTHVIEPFDIPSSWRIVRGFDFGYAKPFSVGWYAVDHKGKIYRITAWYGCNGTPNKGLEITPVEIAKGIKEMEDTHPLLKDRKIYGIADPSIWDTSRGESVAQMMEAPPNFIYWNPGDNTRLVGKMQCHYYLAFDENGEPAFQVFNVRENKDFIRTIPMLVYSERHPEDIDTDMEDHIYDEWRYVLMDRPIAPRVNHKREHFGDDPLNMFNDSSNEQTYSYINI